MSKLEQWIKSDQRAVRNLGLQNTADEIEEWESLSREAKEEFEKQTRESLLSVALEGLKAAIKAAGSFNPPKAISWFPRFRTKG